MKTNCASSWLFTKISLHISIISPSLSQAVYTACHNALGHPPKMEVDCECEIKKIGSHRQHKVCCSCPRVGRITAIHLNMSNLNVSGPKCIVLEVGMFLLIVLYGIFPLMVENCVQEYLNCGVLGYCSVYQGADKSLARPGKKQTPATKL